MIQFCDISFELLTLLSYTSNISIQKKNYLMNFYQLLREEDQKALRDEFRTKLKIP